MRSSSLEKTAERTYAQWPSKVWRHFPVVKHQIFAVLSAAAVSTREPSAEKRAVFTQLVWPSKVHHAWGGPSSAVSRHQARAVQSAEDVSTKAPSGEKTAERQKESAWPSNTHSQTPVSRRQSLAVPSAA